MAKTNKELQSRETAIRTSLAAWLTFVIDELSVHTRSGWAQVLGVSEAAISGWTTGKSIPRPDKLRSILTILRDRYADTASVALSAWSSLATLRPSAAWGTDVKHDAATLGHYVLVPLWERLRRAVMTLPITEQDRLLREFLRATNMVRLATQPQDPADAELDSKRLEQAAPSVAQNKRVREFVEQTIARKTTWGSLPVPNHA